jgi:hypothetical protein
MLEKRQSSASVLFRTKHLIANSYAPEPFGAITSRKEIGDHAV